MLYQNLDRTITNVKCKDSSMYVLYEDSGKQLLAKGDGVNFENLVNEEVTISDFAIGESTVSVVADTFSKQDEVYKIEDKKLKQISKTNKA